MAEKKKFIDVWIVESNTVYREVPYTVVADWVQQGRLLENDQLRPAGTPEWFSVGNTPAFAAYLPKVEPFRVEDQAEALEQVQVDFAWKQARSDEDDDPDMIPLIDVSLVLLIFFMMTATVGGAASKIQIPEAREGTELTSDQEVLWVGVQLAATNKEPLYSLGLGTKGPDAKDEKLTAQELHDHLQAKLTDLGPREVRIDGAGDVPYEIMKKLVVDLQYFRGRRMIQNIHAGVR